MKALVLVLAVLGSGCLPRHAAPEDDLSIGSGGPGGLTTLRAKIVAAIASGNSQYARELLELAADLGPKERALYLQMISAAERRLIPFAIDKLAHIFSKKPGHFAEETAEARELIQTAAVQANLVGATRYGYQVYQRILDTGAQIWVYVRNGKIFEAGINDVPRPLEKLLNP
jgi:hypothetical protein